MEIEPGEGWAALASELARTGGIALILGATDSGKSSLSMYLLRELLMRGLSTALLDADIGQSSLGPPGTVSMTKFNGTEELEYLRASRMCFAGTLNPARAMSRITEAVDILAVPVTADVTLVDTSGLIAGEFGRTLKLGLVRALPPRIIAALAHGKELDHILSQVTISGSIRVFRLDVSPRVRARSRTERATYRRRRYYEYFRGSSELEFPFEGLRLLYAATPGETALEKISESMIVGLDRGRETLALGIVKRVSSGGICVLTPLKDVRHVESLSAGELSVEHYADFVK